MSANGIRQAVSCLDGYDPDALRVDKACEAIRSCLSPISDFEKIEIRKSLGRILAQDVVPSINVPAHDNSAMDGYAVRFSDLLKATRRCRKSAPRSPASRFKATSKKCSACGS